MHEQRWNRWLLPLVVASAITVVPAAWAQNVGITPLGSHAGELCDRDRATIFEDPTGVRILYYTGQSVTGAADLRLGARPRPRVERKDEEFDANAKCVAGC